MPTNAATLELQRLMRALKFDEADLETNRAGRLSESQRAQFGPPRISNLAQMVILGHVALLGGLLGIIALISGDPRVIGIMGVVLVLVMLPFTIIRSDFSGKPIVQADLASGIVERCCGMVVLDSRAERPTYFHVICQGTIFKVSRETFFAFRNQEDYCLYYLPRSQRLLAAEPDAT